MPIKFSELKFNGEGVAKVTFKNKLTCVVETNYRPSSRYPAFYVYTFLPDVKEEWTSCPCYNQIEVEEELEYVSKMIRKFVGVSIVCVNGLHIIRHYDYLSKGEVDNWRAEIHAY